MTVDKMLACPGFYFVSTLPLARVGIGTVIEVTADGTVYQLNGADERDGVLARDGWNDEPLVILPRRGPQERVQ